MPSFAGFVCIAIFRSFGFIVSQGSCNYRWQRLGARFQRLAYRILTVGESTSFALMCDWELYLGFLHSYGGPHGFTGPVDDARMACALRRYHSAEPAPVASTVLPAEFRERKKPRDFGA